MQNTTTTTTKKNTASTTKTRTFPKSIGKKLRTFRTKLGFTQKEVGKKLGFKTGQYLSDCERGFTTISETRLKELAKIYKTNINQLTKS